MLGVPLAIETGKTKAEGVSKGFDIISFMVGTTFRSSAEPQL
jgi:hypothetical protein